MPLRQEGGGRGLRVLVTAATAGLPTERLPAGGGAAVIEALVPALAARPDLAVTLLRPTGGPRRETEEDGAAVVELPVPCLADRPEEARLHLGERAYARFALEWEEALGAELAGVDPAGTVVLSNDVSEGPPFAELARRGFAQVVLYHVVVGEFFARQYLRGVPATVPARVHRGLRRLGLRTPRIARLVWEKEAEAAAHAHAVVPSRDLAASLARLYPASGVAARTHVVPWGVLGAPDPARRERRDEVLEALGLPADRFLVTTLSRLSREKRVELLLEGLRRLERRRPEVAERIALCVAGAPAYMGGAAYARRLAGRAARLRRVAVALPGYVGGDARWDLLAAADLFASTSRYEAFGLSIAQALASGAPVLAAGHEGARAILGPGLGRVLPARPSAWARALEEAVLAPLPRTAPAEWGRAHPFEEAASRLARLLRAAAWGPVPAT